MRPICFVLLLKNKAGAESLPPGITAAYRLILSNTNDFPVPFGASSVILTLGSTKEIILLSSKSFCALTHYFCC